MRDDFYEVIIERPRVGSDDTKFPKGYKRRLQRTDSEELPRREKMRTPRRHYVGEKSQTDLWGPMYRFLRSRVGRPWDGIYSEIRQANDSRSHVQNHTVNHLLLLVERNVQVIDGEVYDDHGYRLNPYRREAFYVHPETGLLCVLKSEPCKPRTVREDRIVLDESRQYRLLDGIWYEVRFQPAPSSLCVIHDVVLKKTIYFAPEKISRPYYYYSPLLQSHGSLIVAVSKRQLNKREIRRLRQEKKIA